MKINANKIKKLSLLLVVALVISAVNLPVVQADPVIDGSEETTQDLSEETTNPSEETTNPSEETTNPSEETSDVTEPTTAKQEEPKIIVPAAVKKFRAESVGKDSAQLAWNKSKNATVYYIYRSDEKKSGKMTKFKKVAETAALSYKDTGLTQATKYQYKIYAYRIVKNSKKTKSEEKIISVLTKPEAVSKLKVSNRTTSSLKVSWEKNSKISKYILYRSDETKKGSFSSYKKIKELSKKTTSYVDEKLSSGHIYKYKIVAQRTKDKITVVSAEKAVKGITKLTAPKKLKSKKITDTSYEFTWKKVKTADYYLIFRDKKQVGKTKDNKFTDEGLTNNTKYSYSVKAVRKFGKKTYKSKSVKIGIFASSAVNGTWVEVSISKQTLYMYVNNKLYLTTPVVTGNYGALSTTKGVHHVILKSSPERLTGSYNGKSWDVTVNYWMRFTSDGQGIHDSTWRSAYGGNIYKGNGSHGCVNTPLAAVKKIYKKAYVGMPVVVY